MKKIQFAEHVLPHAIAVALFLIVTVFFFKPLFFDNKTLQQHDIQQFSGSAKEIIDYRNETGEEALWTNRMFSGMPAYLISVQWGNQPVGWLKRAVTLSLPHPVSNIFAAFVCYYILLLAFGVRPYLAMVGALAFGLSSYMIIGLSAGHNGRIGAIAFMPLVVAGIHLVFANKKLLGAAVTAAGLALHLRENHLQITYYLLLIVLIYGLVQLIFAIKEKQLLAVAKNVGILITAAALAVGTFFGPMWAVQEYSKYSIRGKSELASTAKGDATSSGLEKSYAFEFSNSIWEPMVMLVPNFYGGSSGNFLVQEQKSETYKALVNSGDERMANQLANYTSAYWGNQRLSAPYYAGALVCLLFAIGIVFADAKTKWWLLATTLLGIALSWGDNFQTLNYFLFDYLPGYNKFRSVTFAILLALFSMPLLGMVGLEKLLTLSWKEAQKKLVWPVSIAGGVCLVLAVTGGFGSFTSADESQLPAWFTNALAKDRLGLLRSDAWRSFWFIAIACGVLWARLQNYVKDIVVVPVLGVLMIVDLAGVSSRYFTNDNYMRKRDNTFTATTEADAEILKDNTYYRVYNLQGTMSEARTSYHHQSVGGYHGAKLRRYQDLYDSLLFPETNDMITNLSKGNNDFSGYGVINMLNVKYITYGNERNSILLNTSALGPAWFVQNIERADNATESLSTLKSANTSTTAVVERSYTVAAFQYDSTATISLKTHTPNMLTYESNSAADGFAVFSEIYYPKGWVATVDGTETEIVCTNYVLRGLSIPAGKHTIVFAFKPHAYYVGNTVTTASSWIVLLVLIGSLVISLRKND
jgi:hypothetical protein